MKGQIKFGILIVVGTAIAATGCGGSGGGSGGGSTPSANPYTGNYVGNFVDQTSFIGPYSMQVSSAGAINGQFGYATPVSFSGSVNSSGTGSITDSDGTFSFKFGSAGKTVLSGGIGSTTNGAFFTAVTNPNGQYSGFQGTWSGTVHNNTSNKTGIIAVTITQKSGSTLNFDGVDLFNVNGTPTLEEVIGTITTSTGALSYTVAGVTVTGNLTVSQSNGTITGTLKESDGDTAAITLNEVSN